MAMLLVKCCFKTRMRMCGVYVIAFFQEPADIANQPSLCSGEPGCGFRIILQGISGGPEVRIPCSAEGPGLIPHWGNPTSHKLHDAAKNGKNKIKEYLQADLPDSHSQPIELQGS